MRETPVLVVRRRALLDIVGSLLIAVRAGGIVLMLGPRLSLLHIMQSVCRTDVRHRAKKREKL